VKQPPRIYFSFRSPYSWLALIRMQRAVPGLFDRVEMVPYWDPDPITEKALLDRGAEFHYVQMSKAKHLYLLHDAKRLTAHLGVPMAWPIDIDPWWEVPHLAWLSARRQGKAVEFYAAVTEARWGRGANICDPDVLGPVAAGVGLDPAVLIGATGDPEIREESAACLARAYDDDIFGIPYFRIGRHRFWGYDRVDEYLKVLLPVLDLPVPDLPTLDAPPSDRPASELIDAAREPVFGAAGPVTAYDTDTAGGCG
jgi:2-hydroxychromene-2-carboxylate isomerase